MRIAKIAVRKVEKCWKLEYNNTLSEIEIEGGEILETLAERIREEGRKADKLETAKELIKRGVDKGIIASATGFPLEKIEELSAKVH
jgi:predicted transposase/invertase (TIGR01784 family)